MEKEKFIKLCKKASTIITEDKDSILSKVNKPYISRDETIASKNNLRVILKLMEEMGELTQGLSKFLYKGEDERWNVLEEMCDVMLYIEIVKASMNISEEEFNKAFNVKLNNLQDKLIPKIEKDQKIKQKGIEESAQELASLKEDINKALEENKVIAMALSNILKSSNNDKVDNSCNE